MTLLTSWVRRTESARKQGQRTGHPAGHRRTVHPVCHRLRSGRYPPRCPLQTYPDPLHESLSEQRQLGCRYDSRRSSRTSDTGQEFRFPHSSQKRIRQPPALHCTGMLFHFSSHPTLVFGTPTKQMPQLPQAYPETGFRPYGFPCRRRTYRRSHLPLQPLWTCTPHPAESQ